MLSKVYSFLDWDGWSGERVVLRPEATIPVARLYIDNLLDKQYAKLSYVTNIFRFEETGEEARDRWQCGAELIGMSSPLADVELMMLALEVIYNLGIRGTELRLSHAGLVRALLAKLELSPGQQTEIFDQFLDGDKTALTRLKPGKPELGRVLSSLLELTGKSSGFLKNLKSLFARDLPELQPALNDFITIVDLLEARHYRYRIDITSERGFEYYTGIIFQLFIGREKVGGGGRYDALIPLMGGGDVPASGFGLYFDSLMNLVDPAALSQTLAQKVLIETEAEVSELGLKVAGCLREAGYIAELQLGGQRRADFGWILDVRRQAPVFVLTDQIHQKKYEVKMTDEVLKLLGGRSADKSSVA
jgi:histidyl-tRNA synthetase